MKYRMQIKVWKNIGYCNTYEEEWQDVRPTHGQPYEYDTKEEAERMLKMCYPLLTSEKARIKEISC